MTVSTPERVSRSRLSALRVVPITCEALSAVAIWAPMRPILVEAPAMSTLCPAWNSAVARASCSVSSPVDSAQAMSGRARPVGQNEPVVGEHVVSKRGQGRSHHRVANRPVVNALAESDDLGGVLKLRDELLAYYRVVNPLPATAMLHDVVLGPADTELIAARREFSDEVGELAVVGISADLGSQDRRDVVGGLIPIRGELPSTRTEEQNRA